MGVPAARSAEARRAACGAVVLVLAVDQLSKALVLAAHPAPSGGVIAVRLVRNLGRASGSGRGIRCW